MFRIIKIKEKIKQKENIFNQLATIDENRIILLSVILDLYKDNDIALIRLKEKANFPEYIQPACLPQATQTFESQVFLYRDKQH